MCFEACRHQALSGQLGPGCFLRLVKENRNFEVPLNSQSMVCALFSRLQSSQPTRPTGGFYDVSDLRRACAHRGMCHGLGRAALYGVRRLSHVPNPHSGDDGAGADLRHPKNASMAEHPAGRGANTHNRVPPRHSRQVNWRCAAPVSFRRAPLEASARDNASGGSAHRRRRRA